MRIIRILIFCLFLANQKGKEGGRERARGKERCSQREPEGRRGNRGETRGKKKKREGEMKPERKRGSERERETESEGERDPIASCAQRHLLQHNMLLQMVDSSAHYTPRGTRKPKTAKYFFTYISCGFPSRH